MVYREEMQERGGEKVEERVSGQLHKGSVGGAWYTSRASTHRHTLCKTHTHINDQ